MFESGLVDVLDLTGATLSQLTVTVTTATIGTGGVAFTAAGGTFRVATVTPASTGDDRRWRAISSNLTSASLDGIDGLTLELSGIAVELNEASGTGATPLDWTSLGVTGIDFTEDVKRVRGTVTDLDLFGFVTASNGSVAYESATTVDGELTRIAITVGTASIGTGGIGITVNGGELYVASLVAGARTWRTIESTIASGSLDGIDGLTLAVAGVQLKLNQASAGRRRATGPRPR